jgi:hypothetical protein
MNEMKGDDKQKIITRSVILDFAAFALIILSHFTNYVIYLEYYRIFPDVVIVLSIVFLLAVALAVIAQLGGSITRAIIFAIMIALVLGDVIFELGVADGRTGLFAAGLTLVVSIALALFLGRHTSKVLATAFAAILGTTLLQPYLQPAQSTPSGIGAPESGNSDLPVILHLVLDEHIGLAGMNDRRPGGERLAKDLEAFYTGYGFRLFGQAYSQYFNTQMSLASTLNFDRSPRVEAFLEKGRGKWTLRVNRYFSELRKRGYKARIYQTNYMDFCQTTEITVETCAVYSPDKFVPDSVAELPLVERVLLLANMYYSSIATIRLIKFAGTSLSAHLGGYGLELPVLGLWHGRLGPIAVLPTLERLADDLSRPSGGTLFFAHLMIPHYPYVLRSDCSIRTPISSWELRSLSGGRNTPDSRRVRYVAYYDQIRCTLRNLTKLFDAMKAAGSYEKAIILIHGDHGSRIGLIDPTAENISRLTPGDYIDSFSTLFAAKVPGLAPGIDADVSPISAILPNLLGVPDVPPRLLASPEAYFAANDETYVLSPIVLKAP